MVEVTCEFCGKQVKKTPANISKQKHHFCNSRCYGLYLADVNNKINQKKRGILVMLGLKNG